MKYPEKYLLKMDTKLKQQLDIYANIKGEGARANLIRNSARKALNKFIKEQIKIDSKFATTLKEWEQQQK